MSTTTYSHSAARANHHRHHQYYHQDPQDQQLFRQVQRSKTHASYYFSTQSKRAYQPYPDSPSSSPSSYPIDTSRPLAEDLQGYPTRTPYHTSSFSEPTEHTSRIHTSMCLPSSAPLSSPGKD